MKFFALAALLGVTSAIKLNKEDLPHGPKDDSLIDKLDTMSRYVNDDDILQIKSQNLVQLNSDISKDDLPHGPKDDSSVDKLDPLSRYVNDDDILQIKSQNLVQLGSQISKDDLPHGPKDDS